MSDITYLAHHGIKGQKWGVRNYQNADGSLTALGRARYGVGEARKKAATAIKNSPKTVGNIVKSAPEKAAKAVKQTVRDLKRDYKEAQTASRKRRIQRLNEKAEARALKLKERQAKKTLSDIKAEMDANKIESAKKRVNALAARQEKVRELADLKAQEKYLKSSMKQVEREAKRDAKKKYSRSDIKSLSDEELNARVKRLETEIKLASLEAKRNAPATSAGIDMVGKWVSAGVGTAATQLVGTGAVKLGKQALGLTDDDISEFVRLTKKK